MGTKKTIFIILGLLLSYFVVATAQNTPGSDFKDKFKAHLNISLEKSPFDFFGENYVSEHYFVSYDKKAKPPDLKLEHFVQNQLSDSVALHQQTQLSFFGYDAVSKKQIFFSRENKKVVGVYQTHYQNSDAESRYLLECHHISQTIHYFSVVGQSSLDSAQLKKAGALCASL